MNFQSKQANDVRAIVINVESYPVAHPKFTKKTWESSKSGEGGEDPGGEGGEDYGGEDYGGEDD